MSDDSNTPKPTLLIVDDEPNVITSIKRLLHQCEYEILEAENGKIALEVLAKEPVHVILSDMKMPVMDGAEFLEKAAEKYPQTIRIMLTGQADLDKTIAAINNGKIYQYITKPWDENALPIAISNAMDRALLDIKQNEMQATIQRQNAELRDLNKTLEVKVELRTDELMKAFGVAEDAYQSLKNNYISTIKIFGQLVETRGTISPGSSKKIAESAKKICKKLNMNADEQQQVVFAGLLVSIGNIILSDKLIDRPFAALSANEKNEFKQATSRGADILMALKPLKKAATYIKHLHERIDGKGIPDGLSGEDIPMGTRVLTVVSDFEFLQNGTLTGKKHASAQAINFLLDNRNTRYDSKIVNLLVADANNDSSSVNEDIDAAPQRSVTIVTSDQLTDEMTLATDLKTKAGISILSKGHEFSAEVIGNIQKLENSLKECLDIPVYIDRKIQEEGDDDDYV